MNKFWLGLKDGIPIGLGYFAVAFSLGIVAANAGLNASQGFLTSLLVNASAGESAGFTAIKEAVPYIQMVLVTIVANARYLLMSFALSQKIDPKAKFIHRIILGYYLTDEFFGLAISQDGYADPFYTYGAVCFAAPCWAIGAALGIIMGNILPIRIVSALSVALYGMFLAIIIPPAKKDKAVALLIVISFVSSYILSKLTNISSSAITIILTIVISSLGAILFPRKENEHHE